MSVVHGNRSTYTNHGCRCAACTDAQRIYQQNLREKRRRTDCDKPVPHGSANAYTNYGCRCDACRAAWRDVKRVTVQRKRDAVLRAVQRSRAVAS